MCDGISYNHVPENKQDAAYARSFLNQLGQFTDEFIDTNPFRQQVDDSCSNRCVRIAVIDSGLSNEPYIRGSRRRIIAIKSWVENDHVDECGHGTLVAGLLLRAAPCAELVVAKVARDITISSDVLKNISEAIQWAVNDHDVDIISLSLALDRDDPGISNKIEHALNLNLKEKRRPRIVIAAASNDGGTRSRAFPARMRGVICIHASDGYGNKADFNPDQVEDAWNFSTLGVDIPSFWKGEHIYISGTSYSTPIAAGIIANLLHFARQNMDLTVDELELLHSSGGAEMMLRGMANPRDGYDFICPWRRNRRFAGQSEDQTCASLKDLVSWALFQQISREEA